MLETLVCLQCGREYKLLPHKGHNKQKCNSCSANRSRVGFKKRCVEYLGGCCARCGYNRCAAALQAHHRDPKRKLFNVSSGFNFSWERVRIELDKCDLLCGNCHVEEHVGDEWNQLYKLHQPKAERAKVSWPTTQRLRRLVARTPLTTIAARLGVSSVAVAKRCKKLGVQTKPRGFWGRNGITGPKRNG